MRANVTTNESVQPQATHEAGGASDMRMEFDHAWRWRAKLENRYGHPCRVVARGRLNTIRVEFPDGFFVFTSRYAVRKLK